MLKLCNMVNAGEPIYFILQSLSFFDTSATMRYYNNKDAPIHV